MSAVAFIRKALAMGVELETALAMGEAFEAAIPVYVPPLDTAAADRAMEKRRAYDRQRQAEKRAALKAESTGHPPTSADSAEVQGCPQDAEPAKDAPAPLHVRGENNLSRLVDNNLTTPNFASEPDLDWPGDASPSRAYLDKLEAAVREAGGSALDPTATKLFSLAPILALGRAGKGPACDLQADVLPTIRARSLKAAPQSIGGWDYFTKACLEARDRRLAGAGAVQALRPSGHDPPRRQSLSEQIGAEAAAAKALTLRRLEAANG